MFLRLETLSFLSSKIIVILVFKVEIEAWNFEDRSGDSWRNDSTAEVRIKFEVWWLNLRVYMAGFEFCGFEISEIGSEILVSLRLDFWLGYAV